jgi:glycosyltransferase involved in cell wall biosynthesis
LNGRAQFLMKVLFDYHLPFALAHGGVERQILQTRSALEQAGVEVDFVRWWDADQSCDVIHFMGRPGTDYVRFAQSVGRKVVVADLLTGPGSRSRSELAWQRMFIALCRKFLPGMLTWKLAWDSYGLADACVALTDWEAHLMSYLFNVPRGHIQVVPNGVEEVFFNSRKAERGKWLVCTATITERKRVLELAEAAVRGQTPLWVVGKAYTEADPYAEKFFKLAKQQPEILRYEGAVSDRAQMAKIYREARGFVLLSAMESLSLSALEAAACECPLLLADLPWARGTFGNAAKYCPVTKSSEQTAAVLREFYEAAPSLNPPPKPASWNEVARQLKGVYEGILGKPR